MKELLLVSDLYKVNHRTVVIPLFFDRKKVIPLVKDDNITFDEWMNEIKSQSSCISDKVMNYYLFCIKRTKQFINKNLYEAILDMRVEGILTTSKGTPIGKGAALAYMNAHMNGQKMTQRDIAESLYINESTIRTNYRIMQKEFQKVVI